MFSNIHLFNCPKQQETNFFTLGLVFIFSLGLSITFTNYLAYEDEGGKVLDRVSTMQVDKGSAKTLKNEGYTYYFFSNHCKTTFAKNPEKYACICSKLLENCDCGHCAGEGSAMRVYRSWCRIPHNET